MNVFRTEIWRSYYDSRSYRSGLRVRYENGIDPEVRRAIRANYARQIMYDYAQTRDHP